MPILMIKMAIKKANNGSINFHPVIWEIISPNQTMNVEITSENRCFASPSRADEPQSFEVLFNYNDRPPFIEVAIIETMIAKSSWSNWEGS